MKPLPYGSMVDSSGQLVTMLPPDVDPKQWFAAKRNKQSTEESYTTQTYGRDSYEQRSNRVSNSSYHRESSPGYRVYDYDDPEESHKISNRYSYHEEKIGKHYDDSSEDDVRVNGNVSHFSSSTLPASGKRLRDKNINKSYDEDTWATRTQTFTKPTEKKRSEYIALAALQGSKSYTSFDSGEARDMNHNSYHISQDKIHKYSSPRHQEDSLDRPDKSYTSRFRESSPGHVRILDRDTSPSRNPEIIITDSSHMRYRSTSPDRSSETKRDRKSYQEDLSFSYERPSQAKLNQVNALVARFNEEAKRKIELRKDLNYQPPLSTALVEPSLSTANNNNKPFSYLSGTQPELMNHGENKRTSLSPPKDIVYARVVMDEENERKRTVHSRISPGHDSDFDSLVRRENRKNISRDSDAPERPNKMHTTTVILSNNDVRSVDSRRNYSFNNVSSAVERKHRENYHKDKSRDSSEEKENKPTGKYYYGSDGGRGDKRYKISNGSSHGEDLMGRHKESNSYFRSLDTRKYDKRDSEIESVHEVITKSKKNSFHFEDPIARLESKARKVLSHNSFRDDVDSAPERKSVGYEDAKKIKIVVENENGRSDSDIENLRGYTEYKGTANESEEKAEDGDIVIIENRAKTMKDKKTSKTKQGFFSKLFDKKGSKDKSGANKTKKNPKDIHLKVDLKTPWDKEKAEHDTSNNKINEEDGQKTIDDAERKTKIKKSKSFMSHSSKVSEGESPAVSSSETEDRRKYYARRAKVTRSASSGATLSTKRRVTKHVNRGTNSSSGPMSVNSSESDASHFSQNSTSSTRSHFLHSTMVADIPPAASKLKASRSKPDVSSKEPQRKHVSRSVSLLAPWKPRHYRERYEVNYGHERMPSPSTNGRPPRPPRKKQTHSPREPSVGRKAPQGSHQPLPKDSRLVGWFKRKKEPSRIESQNP